MAAATIGEESNLNSNLLILWNSQSGKPLGSITLQVISTTFLYLMMENTLSVQPVALIENFMFSRGTRINRLLNPKH